MATPAKLQFSKNVVGTGTRLEAVTDAGVTVEIPTIQSSRVVEDITTTVPIKVVVTDDAAPPGNCTLTGTCGKVAVAAGATAVVITHTSITTASKVFAQKLTLDATATDFKVVCTSNTITITVNAAATADTYFDIIIFLPA